MKTRFLNENGFPGERVRAAEVFNTDDEYEIIGGTIFSSSSYFQFKDIPGEWNTVMFSTRWEEAADLMSHEYM
jgi:predicted small integral membrane protein